MPNTSQALNKYELLLQLHVRKVSLALWDEGRETREGKPTVKKVIERTIGKPHTI